MPLDRIDSPSLDANQKPVLDSSQDEHITFTAENTQLFRNGDKSEGDGTVFTTTKHLMWLSADRKVLYQMDWPYILLHAVCRDPQAFPHPCIYAQLDDEVEEEAFQHASMRQVAPGNDGEEEGKEEDEEEDDEEDAGDAGISQIRLVPANPQILDSLYNAMNACAALNPDSDASDGEGDFMFDGLGGGENEEEDYGEGGEDVAAYALSNQQRLQGLQMSMGASAEEMYGDDDDAGEEDEEEEVDPEYAAAAASSRKSKKPDDQSTVANQIASAAAQVTSPSAVSSSGQKGKKRENETEPNPSAQ